MDTEDSPPKFSPEFFSQLRTWFETDGASGAIHRLTEELLARQDFHSYFYMLMMRKRVELGVSPFPTGPSSDLPESLHEAYEEAIRTAARDVGQRLLAHQDIPRAWQYFKLIGEIEPIKQALEAYQPEPGEDTYGLIEVAWQQQVLPKKGFELILQSHGICSAITMLHSTDLSHQPELRDHCIKQLLQAMHRQLKERLLNDLRSRHQAFAGGSIPEIVQAHPELFAEDAYHVDVSHLASIVQMAMLLPKCEELSLAEELCEYGSRLGSGLRSPSDPPFQDSYTDYCKYFRVVNGSAVEAGLAHFAQRAEQGQQEGYQYPAEVLVNLCVKAGRLPEALAAAKKYLSDANERELSCPSVKELAWQLKDFSTLASVAETKSDPVTFLASLIASR